MRYQSACLSLKIYLHRHIFSGALPDSPGLVQALLCPLVTSGASFHYKIDVAKHLLCVTHGALPGTALENKMEMALSCQGEGKEARLRQRRVRGALSYRGLVHPHCRCLARLCPHCSASLLRAGGGFSYP